MRRNSNLSQPESMGIISNTPRISAQVNQETVQTNSEGRLKRIAGKALKGFEIIIKLSHQLYKNYVCVFAQRM